MDLPVLENRQLLRLLNTDNIDNQIHFELENESYGIELSFHSRTSPETFIEGEDFTNLIDIKKGIISRNLVENSNVKIFNDNTVYLNLICGICRDQFIDNNIIRELKCRHHYHIKCIDTWFTENKTCPECRFEI